MVVLCISGNEVVQILWDSNTDDNRQENIFVFFDT